MRKKYILGLIVLSAALTGCGQDNLERSNPLDPQYNAQGHGSAEGYVKYNGIGVTGATVLLLNTSNKTTSDGTGHYFISNLPAGNIILVASAPWYQEVSENVTLADNETKTMDFNLTDGRPSNTFPCAFSPYAAGQEPPTPWSTNKFGTASILPTVNTDAGGFLSASQSVKFTCGTNLNDFSELTYSGINGTKGARVKAAINVSSITQNSFMVALKDSANNGPEIGIYNNNFYRKTPSGTGSTLSGFGAPAQGNFYYVEMVYDSEAGSVAYSVYNSSGTAMGIPYAISGQARYTVDRVSIVLKDTSNATTYAYLDDIDVVRK
ncbi:MAG: hypothetical protein A2231_04330 [Candidatus Firestonebacteria bacterium RIFOXYA2_FULL_40_8]|nr:MAG: hypothetical protein A2231_04330 [Candidatus Firestonebacteria bacterium RIFOXYA2_FULL_40_8]